jgi:hypothetical protein
MPLFLPALPGAAALAAAKAAPAAAAAVPAAAAAGGSILGKLGLGAVGALGAYSLLSEGASLHNAMGFDVTGAKRRRTRGMAAGVDASLEDLLMDVGAGTRNELETQTIQALQGVSGVDHFGRSKAMEDELFLREMVANQGQELASRSFRSKPNMDEVLSRLGIPL